MVVMLIDFHEKTYFTHFNKPQPISASLLIKCDGPSAFRPYTNNQAKTNYSFFLTIILIEVVGFSGKRILKSDWWIGTVSFFNLMCN